VGKSAKTASACRGSLTAIVLPQPGGLGVWSGLPAYHLLARSLSEIFGNGRWRRR